MAVQRITKRVVDALSATDRDVFVWDEDTRGFGIRVWPSGRKTYVVQYRVPGFGRRAFARRMSLGDHGTLTPEQARVLAKRELGKVAGGSDPSADRAARKGEKKVSELGVDYLQEVRSRRKATTAYEYERLWKRHVVTELGSKQVVSVSRQDISRLHNSLRDTPYIANRLLAMLGAFFAFAAENGARSPNGNPAHGVKHYPETARERFLTAVEFARLGEALAQAEKTGLPTAPEYQKVPKSNETRKHRPKKADVPVPANPLSVAAIRLLALTGCRENEILSLKWDAVDFERGYLRLADTKTGASVRPLGASAVTVLRSLHQFRMKDNPHVLPGTKQGQHMADVQRLWFAVRHAADLKGVRLHDLRHSFASVPATSGESMLVLRSLLGHKRVATTERYAHLGDDPVKRAAERASADIAGWLAGKGAPQRDARAGG
jgi:integrase